MARTRGRGPVVGLLAAGLLLLANGTGAARQDEKKEDPLRASLLKLNGVTTEEAQTAKLRELVKDKAAAKKAVAEAVKMMKEAKDEKPFNYNGSLIIGKAAHYLKDYDAAEKFYENGIELVSKLKSGTKMVSAYENLIDLYWDA